MVFALTPDPNDSAGRYQSQIRFELQQLEGLSVDAELKALAEVRENVQGLLSEAKLHDEINSNSIDNKLRSLREQTSKEDAMRKLQELKAKKKALPPAKSTKNKVVDAVFEEKT